MVAKQFVTLTSLVVNFARHVANMISLLFALLVRSTVSYLTLC